MNESFFRRFLWIPVLAGSFGAASLNAGESFNSARVLKHSQDNGQVVEALLFRLPESSAAVVSQDHLIFMDTSASQIGPHRLHALAVLESMLSALPETDRVRLFAVDVQAEALMPTFATTKSDAVQFGLAQLKARIPLGATNLHAVVETALEAKNVRGPCSIIYIGDGMSTADLFQKKDLRKIADCLHARRIPFHNYGVGPQINLEVVGILAHQTGGYIDFDSRIDTGESAAGRLQIAAECGGKLAQAVQRPILYPKEAIISQPARVSLPLLPIRSDRETIHIVRGSLQETAEVIFATENPNELLRWKLSAPTELVDSAFLVAVAREVENNDGLSNSLAGRRLMQVYQKGFADSMKMALQFGALQLERGQTEEAAQVARRVAEFNPSNPLSRSLAQTFGKLQVRQASEVTARNEEARLETRTQPDSNPSLTREQEQVIRVKTEKLRNQVSTAISESKGGEPENGLARLKQADIAVRSSTDIAAADRLQLQKRLESEISQLRIESDKRAQERVQLGERLAQLESQKRLTEQFQLDEEKLEGLIERARALMLEGRHGRDEAYGEAQNVADVAVNLRPGEGTSAAARFDSEAAQQLNRAYRLRARRADQLLETLHQVELSHIPFPDEPPIRFPNAEVWKALSERRRQWASVDLHRNSPRESKIQEELKNTTEVNFTDIPLKDALDYLEELHHIEIWPDMKVMSEEGISTDTTVTLVMSGITLRSVLRLLLEPLLLTYVIEDEVLKITTQTAANEKMVTRVYPVADLVVPIVSPQMGGGGIGGGQGGGLGGQGGGLGGGLGGGFGGGFGGGGGGGLGGGFFSVPPEQVPSKAHQIKPAIPVKRDLRAILWTLRDSARSDFMQSTLFRSNTSGT